MEFPASNGLPGHQGPPQDDDDYSSDLFKLWCMKVIPCTKRFVHDWTICPFAHAGEKAVRRDPRLHNYTGIACPDMKKTGSCIRGEKCPYAHNVFEYWLHPTRYRTQLCNDGPMCRRGICFFAHSLEELRVPACKPYVSPEALARASLEAIQQNPHPLGQQLPNPVAAAQQQAAMAAMGGRGGHGAPHGGGMRGMRDPRDAGPSSLAPSAMPFVPGSAGAGGGGSFRPSGEPVRYSAPGAMPLLGGSPGGDYGHSMGDYGSMGAGHGGPARQGSYGGHPGMQAQQAAAYQQQQQRWAAQQAHQSTYGSMPGVGGGPRGPPARGPDMGAGSAPADSGMRMAAAVARQRSSGDGGAGGYYPSPPPACPPPPAATAASPPLPRCSTHQSTALGGPPSRPPSPLAPTRLWRPRSPAWVPRWAPDLHTPATAATRAARVSASMD
ncbi:hypothetical protein COHA_010168 [Chlorella ohadii]|uniref:C3H1-type domain-containing protein n=1 Tax=Chlorella ohadii TaxID=2649997 RepID=A0AAD5DKD1_9CHLO|nr:hypothetical protein COHA_010168 [Chlorella ohadii]